MRCGKPTLARVVHADGRRSLDRDDGQRKAPSKSGGAAETRNPPKKAAPTRRYGLSVAPRPEGDENGASSTGTDAPGAPYPDATEMVARAAEEGFARDPPTIAAHCASSR